MTELELQAQIADYIRLRYPSVIFHSDFGSGIKLTMGQAIKQKRLNGGRRAWPDMFLAEPGYTKTECKLVDPAMNKVVDERYTLRNQKHGLFIELKKGGTRIYKKDGTLVANEHIREQFDMLADLRHKGYAAEFACGFDEAKKLIDDYMDGELCED